MVNLRLTVAKEGIEARCSAQVDLVRLELQFVSPLHPVGSRGPGTGAVHRFERTRTLLLLK